MSITTLYLGLGAAVLVGLWLVNAVFYRRRHGSFLPQAAQPKAHGGGRVEANAALAAGLFVGMLLLAKAAAYVIPGTAFSLWLEEPYAFVVYCVWGWLLATAMYVLTTLVLRRRKESNSRVARDA